MSLLEMTPFQAFFSGASRVFDLGATLDGNKLLKTPKSSDNDLIESAWKTVGDSLYEAMNDYDAQQKESSKIQPRQTKESQ